MTDFSLGGGAPLLCSGEAVPAEGGVLAAAGLSSSLDPADLGVAGAAIEAGPFAKLEKLIPHKGTH